MKICIIGAGTWGTAIGTMLCKEGHDVRIWARRAEECVRLSTERLHPYLDGEIPTEIEFTNNFENAMLDAKYVVIATPSQSIQDISKEIAKYIEPGQVIVSLAKGFATISKGKGGGFMCLSEVISQENPNNKVAVLTGPSHAEEVFHEMATAAVVACEDLSVAEELQDVFMNRNFRVYTIPDVVGAEVGGALKNIIAICAGIIDGLGLGDNSNAALITRGIAEIARLGLYLGAKIDTFYGLAGIGDLIVTCTSLHSRNRRAGYLIGKGRTVDEAVDEVKMVVEGISATKAAHEMAKRYGVPMPITECAYKILFENCDPRIAARNLMLREKKHEAETVTL